MTRKRWGGIGLVLATGLSLVGCTPDDKAPVFQDPGVTTGNLRLVAYDSCQAAMDGLRAAGKSAVGPYGFGGGYGPMFAKGGDARALEAAPGAAGVPKAPTQGEDYSGTNTNEKDVDEPDLVKTDGKRIVTVAGGSLRVVDAATRKVTGELKLADYGADELLLSGDKVLVLSHGGWAQPLAKRAVPDQQSLGSTITLVDLSGAPTVAGTLSVDGSYLDARQVGSTVRVVVRSAPRVVFPYDQRDLTPDQRVEGNRKLIDKAGPDEWLPRYRLDVGGATSSGRVDCAQVSRPEVYSGASMLTVYSLDLGARTLGAGDPTTIVADGETVYGTGSSLYIANDDRWRTWFWSGRDGIGKAAPRDRTQIFQFDTSKPGRPVYVASGEVPGWLLNQYSLSEFDGRLRVATTSDQRIWGGAARGTSHSGVYVLRRKGGDLAQVGMVDGLGKGERIYAVRFVGPTGYVVTFRQVDPLYVLDLRKPEEPKVTGELKISGYSAYLHPAGDGRLIGVGQEASEQGRVQGTQVSLFDVKDPAKPGRLAQYVLSGGYSEAEFDPHAFLYWPKTGLLVIPVYAKSGPGGMALALKVDGSSVTELGRVTLDAGQIRRSLVIGETLWTVSDAGLKASELSTMAPLGWVPFA
ncbi:beta-propeller domain-containing protein [Longispora sp. K20-0274]|uniref:beta-propeller domain-containing protein n=1 Tax=Longispora sp. K20-0274 TaxID=3088255 RepID=UPI00399C44DE